MFVIVKLSDNYAIGSVVAFSSTDQSWALASSVTSPLGIVEEVEQDSETNEYWGRCSFAGLTYALSDRAVPDEGGELNVEDGAVYVDNSADHEGIIAPNTLDSSARLAGDLVTVLIR